MAAGDSVISICNSALLALGEDMITSLADPVKRAVLCAAQYDPARRAMLRAFPWNCAKAVAQLAADVTGPVAAFDSSYALPADCLRVLSLPDAGDAPWEVWGRNLVISGASGALNMIYIKDLTDPTIFDPLLVDVIGYSLAAALALPLTGDGGKLRQMENMLAAKIRDGRTISSQEASARGGEDDTWLRARGG